MALGTGFGGAPYGMQSCTDSRYAIAGNILAKS